MADFAGALVFADALLAIKPDDDLAIACKCLAYAMDKNLDQAVDLFREPISVPAKDGFDRLETCLLQARANTIFPDAINAGSRGRSAVL